MKKKSIAIIPARGGSKRIPGKNFKPFDRFKKTAIIGTKRKIKTTLLYFETF